jgi:tetratricopeptide (TPR) repeat protein
MGARLKTAEPSQSHDLGQLRAQANDFLRQQKLDEAEIACTRMIELAPDQPDGWVFRARTAQRRNDFAGAAKHAAQALSVAPDRLDVRLVAAESLIYVGQISEAIAAFAALEPDASGNEAVLKQLSAMFTQLGRHKEAFRCATSARSCAPQSLNLAYLVASAAIAIGKMKLAGEILDQLIRQIPEEGDIYYNRATLNKQTPDSNHIAEIQQRISKTSAAADQLAPLQYGLGKELEDVGEDAQAFTAYAKGATARHRRLSYSVGSDVQAMHSLREVFDQNWWEQTEAGDVQDGPVFILGLPRSGTTLVERILSAHSQVSSLGEINDFAYGVVRAGYPSAGKQELMQRSASADMKTLGRDFWQACQGYGEAGPYLIDKTPANYLYLGLIAKSLPKARIIHVHRHPMASGYAMFKTLFRMGYPFSYDLADTGRYILAYRQLMDHWRGLFGGRILDVSYEQLVDEQEAVSRKLITHCGLDWEEVCLQFHQNTAPSATASAAQVRQPIYRGARDIWRQHEAKLAPLRAVLEAGGVSCS